MNPLSLIGLMVEALADADLVYYYRYCEYHYENARQYSDDAIREFWRVRELVCFKEIYDRKLYTYENNDSDKICITERLDFYVRLTAFTV